MRIRLVPEADAELSEATAYLSERSPAVAQRFIADVDEAIQLLLRFPRLGSPLPRELRRFLLKVFPYRIIYRVQATRSSSMRWHMFAGGQDIGASASQNDATPQPWLRSHDI